MKALVYHGPGRKSWDDVADPRIVDDTDAIIGVDATHQVGDTGRDGRVTGLMRWP
jgi:threonine dehydrogenase-like Zn-dependent dehydrogenase